MKIVIREFAEPAQLEGFDSLSARAPKKVANEVDANKQSTVGSLIPVQLESKDLAEFVQTFHPRRSLKAPLAFQEYAQYLAQLSAYINSVFEGLRHGFMLSSNPDRAYIGDSISRTIAGSYENAVGADDRVKTFFTAISNGASHVIKDSIRYKGGKDILYVGLRGATTSPLLQVPTSRSYSVPLLKASYQYQDVETNSATDIGKALLATASAVQKLLLGPQHAELKSSYTRVYEQFAIDGKWGIDKKLIDLFMSGPLAKAGIPVSLPAFKGFITPHSLKRLEKTVSTVVLREPSSTHINQKARAVENTPDESLGICEQSLTLMPEICFSFAINLEQKYCEYITQTKDAQIPLVPLNTWAALWGRAMLKPPRARSADGSGLTPSRIPRYILSPSMSDTLIERKKQLGLYSEPGRVNDDGLYVTGNGDLAFSPAQADASVSHTKEYEKILEDALQISFEAGTPLAAGHSGSTGSVYDIASPNYKTRIADLKKQLGKYRGSIQAINWDLNSIVTVSSVDADSLVSTKLLGANKPDSLNIATYMRGNFNVAMREMFSRTRVPATKKQIDAFTFASVKNGIMQSSIFANFAKLYNHLERVNKVPKLEDLVKTAAAKLNITSLDDENVRDFEVRSFDATKSIYHPVIGVNLTVGGNYPAGSAVVQLLAEACHQAAASSGTNLARYCIKENVEFSDHERYFDGERSTLGEFGNVYAYLGGQVFKQAALAVVGLKHADLSSVEGIEDSSDAPRFLEIMQEVMPMCIMLAKYTEPELREKIYKEADEIAENNQSPKFSEAELNLAGSKAKNPDGTGGMKLFPHQAEALTVLKNHPKIAVLDIAPGGGKTTIGLADIAMLYADGLIKRPFVICPNGLIKNWIEDLHKSFRGWNAIPVSTETYAQWGDERLTDLIKNAPPNTIVVVGNSFLGNRGKMQLVIGNSVETISDSVEFCKKFEPDYIIIDESHRLRNTSSSIHRAVKSINQMSSVKFGRIATGTLIQNVLSDVVGQSAIFNGQIFRSIDDFEAANKAKITDVNGREVYDYTKDTPTKARRRLNEFATVISYKRKEWAFMLPLPIETFISVDMDTMDDPSGALDSNGRPKKVEDPNGHNLRMFYESVLKMTLEEAKADKDLQKLMKKGGDDDEDDDDDDSANADQGRSIKTSEGKTLEVSDSDDDSDNTDALEAALQPYLQRLERLLTDPFGDEELAEVAKFHMGEGLDRENYVSPKVRKVIERIRYHFKAEPWQKGDMYKPNQMADYNGKSYIYRPEDAIGTPAAKSDIAPDSDVDNWKEQMRGKILIFCRFTRSVDAIYRALPPDLKKQAVIFHGEVEGDKWANLNKFKEDPKVKILIANEMGISEGHNLQMASRFIRVESPWAPGELDQSAARIFRPDVGGEFIRQTIFMDWIVCDKTLEVAKMGRLISKMLKKASFDELDNPKYYKNLNPLNLPIIKMSLDNITTLNSLSDLCSVAGEGDATDLHEHSYLGQYRYLISQVGSEFKEMRQTKRASMLDVEPTKMPDSAKELEYVPWVANLKIEDKKDEGLIPIKAALEEEDSEITKAFKRDPKSLRGLFVRTEFGLGTITRVTTTRGESSGEVNRVSVELAQGGNYNNIPASKVYLATKITEATKGKDNAKAPKITQRDKDRTKENEKKLAGAEERARERDQKRKDRIRDAVKPERAPKLSPKPEVPETRSITLYPAVYNQFLALEGLEDAGDSKELRKYGFERFGQYAYLPIYNYNSFTAVLTYLEKHFFINGRTLEYLDSLHDSFHTRGKLPFNVELAPVGELPMFHQMAHKPSKPADPLRKRKAELKVYPLILNGKLMLVVDMKTNPMFNRHINKTIQGTVGKSVVLDGKKHAVGTQFQLADGMDIQFFTKKSDMIACIKQLEQGGFTISNRDELKEEVRAINVKAALTNQK